MTRRLPLNFGPLNRKGGERRLNVAVTRARSEVTVFCSFDPEEMRLSENPAKGLELLKQYLSIARGGSQASADGHTDTSGDLSAREPTAPDHHRADIAAALRARGLRVRENVGLSKFRIDMTVGAADGTDWDVAVLLDGPGWAARSTVYDRDALPPNVLTIMGWPRVVRVWLPSWIQEPGRVLDQIASVVEAANAVPPPPPLTAPPLPAPLAGTPLAAPFIEPLAAAPPTPAPSGVVAGLERPFVPAVDTLLGDREVFDRLPDPAAVELIRFAIGETMLAEAPVHATRLAKIVMTRFGFDRVTPKRTAEILDLAITAQVRRSPSGVFLWPSDVDPATWPYYRRTPAKVERKLDHIAPEEITNAMVDIAAMSHTIDREELMKVVAEIFGFHKLTPSIRDDLDPIITAAVAAGRLIDDQGRLRVNRPD